MNDDRPSPALILTRCAQAGTEVFIRDWQETVVRVVVRDSRLREKDPILGIVNLPLAELFTESSEVTRLFSIQEGVGFG